MFKKLMENMLPMSKHIRLAWSRQGPVSASQRLLAAKGAHGHTQLTPRLLHLTLYVSSVTTNRWFSHLLTEPSQPQTKHLSKLHLLSKRGVLAFSHQLKYSKANQQANEQNKYKTTTITESNENENSKIFVIIGNSTLSEKHRREQEGKGFAM